VDRRGGCPNARASSNTITFRGGWQPQPKEDAGVKVMDIRDGTVRILGKGSWVAAGNWHGDIGIFHGRTTRTYILTRDHRTYRRGRYPRPMATGVGFADQPLESNPGRFARV
jgi:hypothetical protein